MTDSTTGRFPEHFAEDALPDPEPAAPSLPAPDPGIFHHHTASEASDEKDKK